MTIIDLRRNFWLCLTAVWRTAITIKQTLKVELKKKIGNRILGGVVCPIKLRIPRGEAESCCFLPFTCYK